MTDMILIIAALATSAAYACRVDLLSWRNEPGLMLVHVIGGMAAVGVVAQIAQGGVSVWNGVMLMCSCGLLAVTYHRLPGACDGVRRGV